MPTLNPMTFARWLAFRLGHALLCSLNCGNFLNPHSWTNKMAKAQMSGATAALPVAYQDAIVATGLVDDVIDVAALAPRPFRYTEGQYLCSQGEAPDQLWVIVTGSGWLVLLSIPQLSTVQWQAVAPAVWTGILYLAVFCTIISFFLTQFCIPYIGPTRVMAYSYFYPALVLVLDGLLGRGLPPLATAPGIIIVLVATVVLQKGETENS